MAGKKCRGDMIQRGAAGAGAGVAPVKKVRKGMRKGGRKSFSKG
jgi:hypothetical protein